MEAAIIPAFGKVSIRNAQATCHLRISYAHSLVADLIFCYTTLQDTPLSVNEVGAEFVPLQVAWKPGGTLNELPAGMEALAEVLVIVTALPVCEKFPFQPNVITCPFANEKRSVQPFIAVVLVFVMVNPAWKFPGH